MKPLNTPGRHFVHEHVEGRLVELDDVDAVFFQRLGLDVEQVGEGEGHLHLVAVMRVGDGIGDGHGAGQGDLEPAPGMGAGKARLGLVHTALERERAAHHRHHRLVAVGADAHLDLVHGVDAVDIFKEAVDEMLARHLAVADDVDAGVFLQLDHQERGVELALREVRAVEPPLRPQLVGLGEP